MGFGTYKYGIFIGEKMPQNVNPLRQFFRQPAIYLRLPSQGDFWPDGSIVMPENKELPVFPMTAIDDITYRTPDALYNGQATVNVIQSCVPNIKNPWQMPATDLNSILVAIRIASFGHDLELSTTCPKCSTEADYTVDLRTVLDQCESPKFGEPMQHGDLTIWFRPMDYYSQTETGKLQFEQQKSIAMIQESDMPEEKKIEELNKILARITQLTIEALKYSIHSIQTPQAVVTEPEFIDEFLTQCDRNLFTQIRDHIVSMRDVSEFKPIDLKCENCGNEYKQNIQLDQSNFFGNAS
jgi:bacterioferritin-associated ferredoxin